MVKVKKDTINRVAFEKAMDKLKALVRQGEDPAVIVQTINDTTHELTEYIDEKDAELFHIPEWLNQDVTVTVQRKEIG